MGTLHEIVFDCGKPALLAQFWAGLLDGYTVRAYDDGEVARLAVLGLTAETDPTVMVDGPGPKLCFQNVDGRRYDNNRVHLDVAVADRPAKVLELRAAGAEVIRVMPSYTVLADPEGNQFCLVDAPAAPAA